MKKLLSFIFLLSSLVIYGQQEANNWYFGANAGIKFNNDGSTSNLTNGKLATDEGCASISDSDGNLLFYTDGITVWNKQHNPMPNANKAIGNGLNGDPSSTQSAIIVPKPEDPNIYYIFTIDTVFEDDDDFGFNYSTVDLRLNGGLGDVISTSKNINLLEDSSEKISAVLKNCVSKSIWVITFASETGLKSTTDFNNFNTFYAYEVSTTGINTTPIKSTFDISIGDPRGYLKLSPDGTKLACANSINGLYLYDFDPETGIVSNQSPININFSIPGKPQSPYGLEFSQNNEFLYVSSYYQVATNLEFEDPLSQYGALLQYDLKATNINASEFVLDHRQIYRGALQLGPNGKIYRAMSTTYDEGQPYLSVINNPNQPGIDSDYSHNAISLSNKLSRQGLPPFISSFFSEKINITQKEINSTYLPLCNGQNYTFSVLNVPDATYFWTLDDTPLTNFNLEVSAPGLYKVLIQSNTGDCNNLLEGQALIEYFDPPVASPINDVIICDDNNDNKYIFDFMTQTNEGLGSQNPSTYNIKFFKSQEDADSNINEIEDDFENTTNPQRIYTRIGINENESTFCADTSESFNLFIFNSPTANRVETTKLCDEETATDPNVFNGLTAIDLHQFDSEILGDQTGTEFLITYHETVTDATLNNSLPYTFTNTTPFLTTLYARITNKLNPECFDISNPIVITINPKPRFTNTSLIQCDADGLNDQITHFNLNEAIPDLTNNIPNRTIHFFELLNDVESGKDIFNISNYENKNAPQIIFAQIIDDITGCESIAELTLDISNTQINDYEAIPICDELNAEGGINTFNLDAITTEIQTINNILFPILYYSTYEDALAEVDALSPIHNITTSTSQTIFARAENANACYGISEVLLTIQPLPNINTEELVYYCLNNYPKTITINAGLLNNEAPSDYRYEWSNGATEYTIPINEIGTYTVNVINKTTGCVKQRIVTVKASSISTFASPQYIVQDASSNNTIEVFASGSGTYQYALFHKFNTDIYRNYQDSPFFENVSPGIYTIGVKDIKNNCGEIPIDVSVIGFPKFFTPNNDGVNDRWQVIGTSSMFQPETTIRIFNRYGKLVKQLSPIGEGWDGLFNGQKLPSDDYWFAITLQDGRIFKNHFTLKY